VRKYSTALGFRQDRHGIAAFQSAAREHSLESIEPRGFHCFLQHELALSNQ
jgi:hypothetical protein